MLARATHSSLWVLICERGLRGVFPLVFVTCWCGSWCLGLGTGFKFGFCLHAVVRTLALHVVSFSVSARLKCSFTHRVLMAYVTVCLSCEHMGFVLLFMPCAHVYHVTPPLSLSVLSFTAFVLTTDSYLCTVSSADKICFAA